MELWDNIFNDISKDKIAILCGAGISRSSGLPTVIDFYDQLFGYLFNPEDKEYLIELIYKRFDVPFEKIMELILSVTDYDTQLFDIFSNGEPNENHYILASLFAQNYITDIYTTNFDCLIEKAIKNNNTFINYSKFVKESDFANLPGESNKKIIKLHGTTDDFSSIRITLSNLTALNFNKEREFPIKQLFKDGNHEIIIVLGYSFSDVFDVNPVIESLKVSNKIVIIIEHSTKSCELKKLVNENSKNPFNRFTCQGLRLYADTPLFLRWLHKKLVGIDYKPAMIHPTSDSFNWRNCLENWIQKLDDVTKFYLAGRLWSILRHYKKAVNCFSRAYKLTEVQYEHPNYVNIADNLVSSLYFSYGNNSTNGLAPFDICKTVQAIIDTKRKFFLSTNDYYNEKALVLFRMGRLNENNVDETKTTLKFYYSAYRLYSYSKNIKGITKVLHQLAKIYSINLHNTEMGLKIQNRNLILCEEIGYISWVARIYSAMGYICQNSKYSKYRKQANSYYEKSADLLKTGEIDLFVSNSLNQAINFMIDCDYRAAEDVLINALKYPVSRFTDTYYAAILYNLAKCRIRLNNLSEALNNILEVESIYVNIIKNKENIIQSRQVKAIILFVLGKKADCIELLSHIENDVNILSEDDKGHYYFYRALYHFVEMDFKHEKWQELAYKAFKDAESLDLYSNLCKEFAGILRIEIPFYQN